MKKIFVWLVCSLLVLSCNNHKGVPNIKNSTINIQVQRFDNDLFSIPPDSIVQHLAYMRQKYELFFEFFNEGIIGISNSTEPDYPDKLREFFNYKAVVMARKKVLEVFPDNNELSTELTNAFRYYNCYFPDKAIPSIFTYISGFNTSILASDSIIGIGLDKFLGADYEAYTMLATPRYLCRNMRKEKIPSDCMMEWAKWNWPYDRNAITLLSKMIYEGKLIYFTSHMLPNEADSLILGFTSDQMKWCEENENNMWAYLIEQKLLYATENKNITTLTEEAPTSPIFPKESPGRACNWIGYNIVKNYMKRNPSVSLADLMDNEDYQTIFNQAKYKPAK